MCPADSDIEAFEHALQDLISGKASLLLRMRLQMSVHGSNGQELTKGLAKQQGKCFVAR